MDMYIAAALGYIIGGVLIASGIVLTLISKLKDE